MSKPSEPHTPGDLVTTSRAATILKVSVHTVLRWILAGRLRAWKVAGRYRVSEADARAMLRPVLVAAEPRERTAGERKAAAGAAVERLRRKGLRV
jgi:excisionase family DNA binding protein